MYRCSLTIFLYCRRSTDSRTRLINTSTLLIGWYEFLHEFLFHDIQLNFVILNASYRLRRSLVFLARSFTHQLLLYSHAKTFTKTCFISFLSLPLCVFISSSFIVLNIWCLKILKFQFKNNKNIFPS